MRNSGNLPLEHGKVGKSLRAIKGADHPSSGLPDCDDQAETFDGLTASGSPKGLNRGRSQGLGDTKLRDPQGYGSDGVATEVPMSKVPASEGKSSSIQGQGSEDLLVKGFDDPANLDT